MDLFHDVTSSKLLISLKQHNNSYTETNSEKTLFIPSYSHKYNL